MNLGIVDTKHVSYLCDIRYNSPTFAGGTAASFAGQDRGATTERRNQRESWKKKKILLIMIFCPFDMYLFVNMCTYFVYIIALLGLSD